MANPDPHPHPHPNPNPDPNPNPNPNPNPHPNPNPDPNPDPNSGKQALYGITNPNLNSGKQALYGIIQGGVYPDLRDESADFINQNDFFGTAIGGSLGADKQSMHDIVAYTRSKVREDRPIHLLGIGGVRDIFHGVRCGIDTFDCVHPTRLGRHGGALVLATHWDEPEWSVPDTFPLKQSDTSDDTGRNRPSESSNAIEVESQKSEGNSFDVSSDSTTPSERAPPPMPLSQKIKRERNGGWKYKNQEYRTIREHISVVKSPMRHDPRPIDSTCRCYTCTNFSRAYLHHLYKADEQLGGTLVTIHNIHFMNRLMKVCVYLLVYLLDASYALSPLFLGLILSLLICFGWFCSLAC